MRKIRELLLTEYIGAILIAMLAAQAIITLLSMVVGQVLYYSYFAHLPGAPGFPRSEPILSALVRVGLYLITAYLLAKWLYLTDSAVVRNQRPTE